MERYKLEYEHVSNPQEICKSKVMEFPVPYQCHGPQVQSSYNIACLSSMGL